MNMVKNPSALYPQPGLVKWRVAALALIASIPLNITAPAQERASSGTPTQQQLVIIDTDIGDDIDDVLALGLALSSPELKVLGVTTAWGNTLLRARLVDRFLSDTGNVQIPVGVGIPKHKQGEGAFSQARWAERGPDKQHQAAVDFILQQIRLHPGEITLVELGPMTNLGAALESDPDTFRKLKRIVAMCGAVRKGYDRYGLLFDSPAPVPEYNIAMDIEAARKVFESRVPLYVMPLDSTQLKLDELKREQLFAHGSAMTDDFTLLYHEWSAQTGQQTPTMFDVMAVAYAVDPNICPVTPVHLSVGLDGVTHEEAGKPNTWVCLHSSSDPFFQFYLGRILHWTEPGDPSSAK